MTGLAVRSRLGVAGLVLVAGLFGFVLGRVTTPDPPEDPRAWSPEVPAPTAPEAPAWKSQSTSAEAAWAAAPEPSRLGPTARGDQPSAPVDASVPAAWGTPTDNPPRAAVKAAESTWNQGPPNLPSRSPMDQQTPPAGVQPPEAQPPWSQPAERPADGNRRPRWTANQGMALPEARAASQPESARRVENDPYAAAWMARRPTTAMQPAAQPNAQPSAQPAGGATGHHSVPRYSTPGAAPLGDQGTAPAAASPSPSQESGYPSTGYPSTGYPAEYPSTGRVFVR